MRNRRNTAFLVLSLLIGFSLYACGGGGDSATSTPTPRVTTVGASSITVDNAVLNGSVNPNGLATNAWFEWGTDSGLAAFTTTTSQPLGSGTGDNTVTQKITGLNFGTTYYFRVAGSNSAGTTKGLIVSFTTASPNNPPTVQTFSADNISITAMTLHGNVIPNGLATDAWFEYGTDNTFTNPTLTHTTTHRAMGSGMASVQIDEPITGLDVATTYYYRVVASNSAGTSHGLTGSQSTSALTPTVTTQAADNVTTSGANLKGLVNPNGLATTAWFEWGTSPTLATFTQTSAQVLGSGLSALPVNAQITGLSAATTYYFRVAASNSAGSPKGTTLSFTTPQNPPPTANAGPDQVVYMLGAGGPTVITLDGTGSSDAYGTITTYLWEQTAGTTVTLSDDSAAQPTFTAPVISYPPDGSEDLLFKLTVTDNRGLSASDNVTINVKWAFLDDFSTNTTGTYTVVHTWGTAGTFTYGAQVARVLTGASNGLLFEHAFGVGTGQGVFAFNYAPVAKYSAGSGIEIRLGEDFNTCYVISTIDNVVQKYRSGVLRDSVAFTPTVSTGTDYWVKISFSPEVTTVTAFGQTVSLTVDDASVPVTTFWVSTVEQDAYYDNLVLDVVY